jgi:hypothetical protein
VRSHAVLAALALATTAACGPSGTPEPAAPADALAQPEGPRSRDAKPDTVALLRKDLAAARSPADGGGRAWIESVRTPDGSDRLRAGDRARIELVYEAGPAGVDEGGAVFLETSPFWGWETPQTSIPDAPGYTEVSTSAEGVALEPQLLGPHLLAIGIEGHRLDPGERIAIRLGAGPAYARVDRFAEREERIWLAVDGDGDGVRELIGDSPRLDVAPGGPARLLVTLPTTARPGEPIRLALAVVDGLGNAGVPFEGDVELEDPPEGLELPARVHFDARQGGVRQVEGVAAAEGIYRLRARARGSGEDPPVLEAESNPLIVSASAPRILWADLHGHSQLSDGTGTPEDYFRYARDVADLDVSALTDHDHWGLRFLDRDPAMWKRIVETVKRFHEPGRFVTILGYEWTNWLHGHRHVLYFADDGPVVSSLDPATDDPAELWAALAGLPALTFAHHSAGGPISTDWSFVPDPRIEPVTEIVSVHGSSEAMDSPGRIYSPVEGNFVRDVLDRGVVFGFVGSGDSHDGHPGLPQLAAGSGGLAAVFSEELSREGVLEALRARHSYATNGPRIWLRFALAGRRMGSVLPVADGEEQELEIGVVAVGPIQRIDLIRSGAVAESIPGKGERSFFGSAPIPRLESGEYVYLRVVQEDGGAAWSSPIYAR